MQQQGMFGMAPADVQRQVALEEEARMMQLAKMDPASAQRFRSMQAGQQLGQAGAGMLRQAMPNVQFGPPEDPRIAEAQKMEGVKKGIMESGVDPADIDTFYPEMIKRLYQGGMLKEALQLEKQYQDISNRQDAVAARKASSRELALENQMPGLKIVRDLSRTLDKAPENAGIIAQYRASVTPENPMGDIKLLEEMKKNAAQKAKVDGSVKVGINAAGEEILRDKDTGAYFTTKMTKLPDGQIIPVRQYDGDFKVRSGGIKIENNMPGLAAVEDTAKLRKEFRAEVKVYDEILTASGAALNLSKAASEGNPSATVAFQNAFAKTFKSDSQVANAEINRLIGAGALDTRIANAALKFFSGTVTAESIEAAKEAIKAMRKFAREQRGKSYEQWKKAHTGRLSPADLEFVVGGAEGEDGEFDAPTSGGVTLSSGKKVTVSRE